jgi:hypothetical protein
MKIVISTEYYHLIRSGGAWWVTSLYLPEWNSLLAEIWGKRLIHHMYHLPFTTMREVIRPSPSSSSCKIIYTIFAGAWRRTTTLPVESRRSALRLDAGSSAAPMHYVWFWSRFFWDMFLCYAASGGCLQPLPMKANNSNSYVLSNFNQPWRKEKNWPTIWKIARNSWLITALKNQ